MKREKVKYGNRDGVMNHHAVSFLTGVLHVAELNANRQGNLFRALIPCRFSLPAIHVIYQSFLNINF
jgi:hypothetical protein